MGSMIPKRQIWLEDALDEALKIIKEMRDEKNSCNYSIDFASLAGTGNRVCQFCGHSLGRGDDTC
jgi:hypothetical protein